MDKEQSFLKAYDEYADAIFRHCYFRVFDRELAKDLVQEVYTRAWVYLSDGHEIQNFRAFLYRVANNLVIDHARKRKMLSLDQLEQHGLELGRTDPPDPANAENQQAIMRALGQLEPKYREMVTWRYLDGLKPRQIARLTGMPIGAVYLRTHRGLKRLRRRLTHE